MAGREWETREHDLQTAWRVIFSHYQFNESETGYHELALEVADGHGISRADWVIDLEETFERQYGEVRGRDVANKVLTELMTDGETRH